MRSKKVLASFLLALSASAAQAEICVQNDTLRKVQIIQAGGFTPQADGSLKIDHQVDKRVLMPQEEYCVPAGDPFYVGSTRFAFELIASLNDVARRMNSARFNILEKPLPAINSTLTISGTLAAPRARVLANHRLFNYGRLTPFVITQ